jgi:hypothetical protein
MNTQKIAKLQKNGKRTSLSIMPNIHLVIKCITNNLWLCHFGLTLTVELTIIVDYSYLKNFNQNIGGVPKATTRVPRRYEL